MQTVRIDVSQRLIACATVVNNPAMHGVVDYDYCAIGTAIVHLASEEASKQMNPLSSIDGSFTTIIVSNTVWCCYRNETFKNEEQRHQSTSTFCGNRTKNDVRYD